MRKNRRCFPSSPLPFLKTVSCLRGYNRANESKYKPMLPCVSLRNPSLDSVIGPCNLSRSGNGCRLLSSWKFLQPWLCATWWRDSWPVKNSLMSSSSGDNTNYYDALGVGKNASQEELRKAFQTEVIESYPDKSADSQKLLVKPSPGQFARSGGFRYLDGWREFAWGALAGGFGETIMHPVDTLKTRIQSQSFGLQSQKQVGQLLGSVRTVDGVRGLYRGVVPGITGSLVTGATYFGFIESTKDWLRETNPSLEGPWAHFLAGAIGDTIGSVIYVPCEVIKQRMQVQGTPKTWQAAALREAPQTVYYTGIFQAAKSIVKQDGPRGLYAGYLSTLARDVPFAGLQIMFYEALRTGVEYGHQQLSSSTYVPHKFGTLEELGMGGAAGGLSAFLTTPFDVIKTRLQVQGFNAVYAGWTDALRTIWREEGVKGFFRGAVPRICWFVPASGLTFMAVEYLRKQLKPELRERASAASVITVVGPPLDEIRT